MENRPNSYISNDKINHKRELTKEEQQMIDDWIKLNGKPVLIQLHQELEKLFNKDKICVIKTIN